MENNEKLQKNKKIENKTFEFFSLFSIYNIPKM